MIPSRKFSSCANWICRRWVERGEAHDPAGEKSPV
jgi:hypothetical protein